MERRLMNYDTIIEKKVTHDSGLACNLYNFSLIS